MGKFQLILRLFMILNHNLNLYIEALRVIKLQSIFDSKIKLVAMPYFHMTYIKR
jgi:hypothetical protein